MALCTESLGFAFLFALLAKGELHSRRQGPASFGGSSLVRAIALAQSAAKITRVTGKRPATENESREALDNASALRGLMHKQPRSD